MELKRIQLEQSAYNVGILQK